MATVESLNIKIGADTKDLTKAMLRAKVLFAGLSAGVRQVGRAFKGFEGFITDSVKAAGVQQDALNNLTAALGNAGVDGARAAAADFAAFASELQSVTTIGDEASIAAASIGARFGITGDKLKETVEAAANLSAVTGQDLKSAMILLGKAAKGETGTLSRYGIIIDKNLPRSAKFAAALRIINEQFGGAAQAKAQSYSGRVQQMTNLWGDFQEAIGDAITGNKLMNAVIETFSGAIANATSFVVQNANTIRGWINGAIIKALKATGFLVDVVGFLAQAFKGLQLVGTIALGGLLTALKFVVKALEASLRPVSFLFDALVKLGKLDANPLKGAFEGVNKVLDTGIESTLELGREQLKAVKDTGTAFDEIRGKVDSFTAGVLKAAGLIKVTADESKRSVQDTGNVAKEAAKSLTEAAGVTSESLGAMFGDLVRGAQTFDKVLLKIIASLIKVAALRAAAKATGPLGSLLGFVGGIFGSFHEGGTVQASDLVRLPGMAPTEGLAVLEAGEQVLSREDGGRDSRSVVINNITQSLGLPTRAHNERFSRDTVLPAMAELGLI